MRLYRQRMRCTVRKREGGSLSSLQHKGGDVSAEVPVYAERTRRNLPRTGEQTTGRG